MNLQDLINYKEVHSDEIIFNNLTKNTDDEIVEYIISVTSDLLNGVFLTDEFKLDSKQNLGKYTNIELGEMATYMAITPFVQVELSKESNWQEKATSYLECFIGYIIGTIDKQEFIKNLHKMKDIINISTNFYNGIILYFADKKDTVVSGILDKLQF